MNIEQEEKKHQFWRVAGRVGKLALKRYAQVWLATTILSGTAAIFPSLVSSSYEDITKNDTVLAACRPDFDAARVRVYGRYNPLAPFHAASVFPTNYFRDGDVVKGIGGILGTPFSTAYMLAINYGGEIGRPGLVGYSLHTGGDLSSREAYIYPVSAKAVPRDILRSFDLDVGEVRFKSDPDRVAEIIRNWIFLHEAQHGSQPGDMGGSLKEADADVVSLSLLSAHTKDTAAFAEAREFIIHLRTIAGMSDQDGLLHRIFNPSNRHNHFSAFSIVDDTASADLTAFSTKGINDFYAACQTVKVDDGKLSKYEQWYFAAQSLIATNAFADHPGAQRAAEGYIKACEYFYARTGQPQIGSGISTVLQAGDKISVKKDAPKTSSSAAKFFLKS